MSNGNISYSQDFLIKYIPIKAGRLVCVFNEIDARELGVLPMDRVEVTNKRTGKKAVAVVDVTKDWVPENHVGIFSDVLEKIDAKQKETVSIKASEPLKSLDLIKKKMDGEILTFEEISLIVNDISQERLSEAEASAFVSSVYINGLNLEETISMTKALIADGNRINFSKKMIVDKHSVGGVNGRATMIIVPIVAAAGLYMPKTSSRSITSCAGTADSMEVLAPVDLDMDQVKKITERVGGVITWGGAVDLAPADDKIIQLEHPLSLDPEGQVIASVLAKKASVGSKFVVIDLPVGRYVKIKDKETAMRMAKTFVQVGKEVGMEVESVITSGEEPCGLAFGPALEAKYAMEILEGKRFDNLAQKSCELAGVMFELVGMSKQGQGYYTAVEILKSGKALEKMKEIIKAQGGKIFSSEQIPLSKLFREVKAKEDGVIEDINTKEMTRVARLAGAPANANAGIMMAKIEGEKIQAGDVLFTIYAENEAKLISAFNYADSKLPYAFRKIIISTVR
ncbi:MAG: AMP phosphorylase [archaeon]